MSVSNINLDADRIAIKNDSLTFRVSDFSFKERSGLNMQKIAADTGIICFGKEVTLRGFRLVDDFSDIKMKNLSMLYDGGKEFSDFINKVRFVVDISDSHISFVTLGYFAPVLNHIPVTADFSGRITGPVANFRSDYFELATLDKTFIDGRFSMFGLPDIENTMIFADLKRLETDPGDINTIINGITDGKFNGDKTLHKFGNMYFNGTFTGLVNDFVSYGYLKSALGNLEVDILFKNQENSTGFKGELVATDFNAGELVNSSIMGRTSCNVMVDGTITKGKNDIFGKGTISSLEFNDYKYHNVNLEGRLVNQSFDGKIVIAEPNFDLDFNGNINLAGDDDGVPVFNFDADLKHIDLVKLKFNQRDTISIVKAKINANFKASSILNYIGELTIDSLFYHDNQSNIDLGKIILSSSNNENQNHLELISGFMDAKYSGQNDLGGFVDQLQYLTQKHIPELFPETTKPEPVFPGQDYDFSAQIKEAKGVARIFVPGLFVEKGTGLTAKVDTNSEISLTLTSNKISYNDNQISNLKLLCNSVSDSLDVNLSGNFMASGLMLNNFQLDNAFYKNEIGTNFRFNDPIYNSDANISLITRFFHEHESGKLLSTIDMHTSNITLYGQKWDLDSTFMTIGNKKFGVEGFNMHRRGQNVEVAGIISENFNDSLRIKLTNLRLQGFNRYTLSSGYRLSGIASGEIDLCGLYVAPLIIGAIQIDTVVVNNDTIGNFIVASMWNNDNQRMDITTRMFDQTGRNTSLNGYFVPNSGEISASGEIKDFKLSPVEPLLDGVLSDISGVANGNIEIGGTLKNPDLSGNLRLDDMGLTVDYLQTHYVVNSDIDISGSKISIRNGQIKDNAGNTGVLTINLTHNHFKDIEFDANANVRNFMSLNTKSKDNPLFYGTAYTSGVVNAKGNPARFNFAITAETNSNSILYIPLSSTSDVKEFEFLTFVNKADSSNAATPELADIPAPETKSSIKLGLDLAVTPDSEIQILIDPKVGDILRARGRGNLKINVDPSVELFNITGDYSIEDGDYNFTLPNFSIVSHKFTINKGSRIRFNGDITNAELDVTASFKVRTSLSALFPDDSLRNYPVECQILITGRMTNPTLRFNIDIQNIDPEKKSQFANLVNTEEKMVKQFIALLVLRSFIPEQSFANQDLGSSTLMSNASELLSAQIGSLISLFNLPIPLDVNVDYNTNARNNTGSEFGVDFGTQLFERVLLNGSVSNATTSNRSFIGDFELEVLLGKYDNTRFKVFSKSRDYFSDDMESNRNGIGLSYRSQFDKFIDIFRRKKKKDK
jgi:hypothetical protein